MLSNRIGEDWQEDEEWEGVGAGHAGSDFFVVVILLISHLDRRSESEILDVDRPI